MAFETLKFTKSWTNSADFPTYEPSEQQVRADLQLLHDETRDGFNRLVRALNGPEAAGQLPFRPVDGLKSSNVQAAITEVLAETRKAAAGTIPNGTVTREKLEPGLLDRVYGGRVFLGLDSPGSGETPETDFPLGQLWLRPAHTVTNLAGTLWSVNGGTCLPTDDGWRFVSAGGMTALTATQQLEHLGQPGDRVFVHVTSADRHAHLMELGLWLDGVEQDLLNGGGVFEATLDETGGLELSVSAQWPYEEPDIGFRLADLTVVNADDLERDFPGCRGRQDWPGFLRNRVPFAQVQLPWSLFLQVAAGQWVQLQSGEAGT